MLLHFPFTIAGESRISEMQTEVERKQRIVSFCLPHDISLTIPDAVLISEEWTGKLKFFVFEFEELDQAIEWMGEMSTYVEQKSSKGDVTALEKEMDDFMRNYEEKEKKKRKKMVDEDGFTYYE